MSTILDKKNITDAVTAIDTYVKTATDLNGQLATVMAQLIGSGFVGEAAEGYKTFYTSKVVPALTTNLIDPQGSLMASLKQMMTDIGAEFFDNVDTKLGEANQTAGDAE